MYLVIQPKLIKLISDLDDRFIISTLAGTLNYFILDLKWLMFTKFDEF